MMKGVCDSEEKLKGQDTIVKSCSYTSSSSTFHPFPNGLNFPAPTSRLIASHASPTPLTV